VKSPLRILYLEDDPRDAELVQETLAVDGIACQLTRVETQADFIASLEQGGFDLVLADHTLPNFDGLSALKIAQRNWPDIPFIFVSGTLGEEVATEALKVGATDFVLKTRLSRIGPLVQRALRESEERIELNRSEEARQRSEAYLAEAQKISHTGSFGWNVGSGAIYWSRETFRIFEFEPSAKPTIELILQRTHPEDRSTLQQFMEGVSRERKEFDFEHRLLMPDGSVRHVRVVGRRSKDGAGNFEFVGAVTDITERKRAEEALRRSENYLAEAQRLTHSGSWVWEVARRDALHLSDEWYRIYEFNPEDGMPDWEKRLQRVLPVDRATWQGAIDRAIREKTDYEVDFRILLPVGRIKWIHTVGHPILDASGELVQFVGSSMDITERKRAEKELRRSESYLAEAQKLSHTGSWAVHVGSMENIYWSPEMYRIFGLDAAAKPPSYSEVSRLRLHPDDTGYHGIVDQAIRNKTDFEADYRLLLPQGGTRHIHTIGHPVVNASGEVVEIVGTAMDVTEQHESRAALETAFAEIKTLRDQLYKENIALREEIDKVSMFEEIVGKSPALQAVLKRVAKVAPADTTVLITGETGTGKELIARAIHKRSHRASRPFVSVNCAAIPTTLIAPELFGHEKGAFTGAVQRRLGRFELADGGTIFLDEIGELPAETQVTLLHVLQEREFERIGGSRTIQVDVRVIAATNRDLEKAIADGAFRSDLFYRLNVIPIEIPPLRERKEDIATLVEYFIQIYARKAGKKIATIEKRTLELLESYAWPGNIRELQNVIERSVIVCDGGCFSVDPSWLSLESSASQPGVISIARKSAAQQKEAIEKALAATAGRVAGPTGAAAMLGVPRQTLESKIASLGINKRRFKSA
jgi:DNA-binding NtrC family response regulator